LKNSTLRSTDNSLTFAITKISSGRKDVTRYGAQAMGVTAWRQRVDDKLA